MTMTMTMWSSLAAVAAGVLFGCGGTSSSDIGGGYGGQGTGGAIGTGSGPNTGGGGSGAGGFTGRTPAQHRATATTCDDTRPYYDAGAPDYDAGWLVECRTHAECTQGQNGRCTGNGHDGWHCTYDLCRMDSECVSPTTAVATVCECAGGFRSDNNICLSDGNCRTDSDCSGGAGYCSPSLGSCGSYTGTVGYYCHTPADECLDDSDCGGDGTYGAPYCAYMPTTGRWSCSSSHCVG